MIGGPVNENAREQLRAYLLDTLDAEDRAAVEREVEASPAWRNALDEERQNLAKLDLLPRNAPPHDLTANVMDAIAEKRVVAFPRKPLWKRWWPYAGVAAAACVALAILLPALTKAREAARNASDQGNLKTLALVLKMYANDHGGEYPPITPYKGVWMFDLAAVYPEYLTDLNVVVSPKLPNAEAVLDEMVHLAAQDPIDWERITRLAAQSYAYAGWVVDDAADIAALRTQVATLDPNDRFSDLQVNGETLHRPREGVERFFITDVGAAGNAKAQSEIPIVFNSPTLIQSRPGESGNVLYMDGHVKSIGIGDAFPMQDEVLEALK